MELASFVSRLLREYRPPEGLRKLLEPMIKVDVFSAPERDGAQARLDRQARRLTTELKTTITSVQGWLDLARAILIRVNELMKEDGEGGNFNITDPYRDLGLVRWGKILNSVDISFAVETIRTLFSGDDKLSAVAATELAIIAEEKLTESCCVAVGSVLWMLGLFDRVGTLIINYQNDHADLPLPLDLMRAAARLRQRDGAFSQIEKELYLEAIDKAVVER